MKERKSRTEQPEASSPRRGAGRAAATLAVGLALSLAVTACENPLDVENPNNVIAENVDNPAAVNAMVNGALSTTADAWGWVLAVHATSTDEVRWIGSRDAWNQLAIGNLSNRQNEFTDVAFPQLAEARFQTQAAVDIAEKFKGELPSPADLPRAYFFAGLAHGILAVNFENFAFPERPTEPAAPIGAENMGQVFDMAIDFASKAITEAEALGATSLATRAYALRAWATHQKAIWTMLNPPGSTPSDPLINNSQVNSDARTVLNRVSDDWTWEFLYSAGTNDNEMADWMLERGEHNFHSKFVEPKPGAPASVGEIVMTDPLDDVVDPHIEELINEWLAAQAFAPIVALSAREMRLILAEAALAQGDTDTFEEHINAVRTLDGLSEYSVAEDSDEISPTELLDHERLTDLYLQMRRLPDLYRFGERSPDWGGGSVAVQSPGTVFPVTITECRANPNFNC